MKKTLVPCLIAVASTSLFADGSFEGVSVSLYDDLANTTATTANKATEKKIGQAPLFSHGIGLGVDYAKQFNQFVLGVGAYYTLILKGNKKSHYSDGVSELSKKNDMGARLKFGYALKGAMPFLGIGYASVPFKGELTPTGGQKVTVLDQKFSGLTYQLGLDALVNDNLIVGLSTTYASFKEKETKDKQETLQPTVWTTRIKVSYLF